jgi:hypothetical protein
MLENLLPSDYPDFYEFGATPCSESFPDAFFKEDPPEGNTLKRGTYLYEREAKGICLNCPYKARCLEYALRNPDVQGIWGGTNESQREALRRGFPVHLGLPAKRNR